MRTGEDFAVFPASAARGDSSSDEGGVKNCAISLHSDERRVSSREHEDRVRVRVRANARIYRYTFFKLISD